MRSDKFIGTARIVSIYGRKFDVIFKHAELNSLGRIHADYHNHNKYYRYLRWSG